jgi:hypothetical protein
LEQAKVYNNKGRGELGLEIAIVSAKVWRTLKPIIDDGVHVKTHESRSEACPAEGGPGGMEKPRKVQLIARGGHARGG